MPNIRGICGREGTCMRKFALVVGAVLGLCGSAFGQDVPRAEVFGGYSYLNVDTKGVTDRVNANGWEASGAFNFNRWFGAEGDLASHYNGDCAGLDALISGASCRHFSFMGGPRFTYRLTKFTVFAHGLFGGGHLSGSTSDTGIPDVTLSASETKFAMAAGGGLDYNFQNHISIRFGQVDYFLTKHFNQFGVGHQNNIRVSAGIVIRFGGIRGASSGGRNQTTSVPIQTGPASEAALLGVSGYATDTGFKISSVRAGSPAAQIYLNPGDTIFEIDGRDVHSSHDIEAAIAASASGTVKVTFRNHEALGAKSEREVKVR